MENLERPFCFERADLVDLSEIYYGVADTISPAPIDRRAKVLSLDRDTGSGRISVDLVTEQTALNPLIVLKTLRDMQSFRGVKRADSRRNTITAAMASGSALAELEAIAPPGDFSAVALGGLQTALKSINMKLAGAFNGVATYELRDKEVINLIREGGQILQKPIGNT